MLDIKEAAKASLTAIRGIRMSGWLLDFCMRCGEIKKVRELCQWDNQCLLWIIPRQG